MLQETTPRAIRDFFIVSNIVVLHPLDAGAPLVHLVRIPSDRNTFLNPAIRSFDDEVVETSTCQGGDNTTLRDMSRTVMRNHRRLEHQCQGRLEDEMQMTRPAPATRDYFFSRLGANPP